MLAPTPMLRCTLALGFAITTLVACTSGTGTTFLPQDGGTAPDGAPCACPQTETDAQPVCGADGRTYDSSCYAACAQQTVAHSGACAIVPPGDPVTGPCTKNVCGSGAVCIDDGCTTPTCLEAGDGGTCPSGYTHESASSCGPVGPPPSGICSRECQPAEIRHHCQSLPASCSPITCKCLPSNPCPQSQCGAVQDGIVECAPQA